jgi:hypothetical protein
VTVVTIANLLLTVGTVHACNFGILLDMLPFDVDKMNCQTKLKKSKMITI